MEKVKKSKKNLIIGIAIIITIILVFLLVGIGSYFLFFKDKITIPSNTSGYSLRTAPGNYLSSEAGEIYSLSSGPNEINSLMSQNGLYYLFLDEHGSILILKKEQKAGYTVFKKLYDNDITNAEQPFILSIYNRSDLTITFNLSLLTLVNLNSSETTPTLHKQSKEIDILGVDTNNYAITVSNNGDLVCEIYSGTITANRSGLTQYKAPYIIKSFI